MIIAAQKYKPDKGTRFITYAAFWIKQSIIRYSEQCAGSVRVPAYMKVNIRNYERFCADYKSQTGGHPPEGEICQALGINKRSLKILEKVIYEVNAILSNASSVSGTVFEVSVGSSVMKFMVLDENEKTVQVGDNHANAISWFYTGNLFIPDSVVYNGESYSVIKIGDGAFYNRTLLTGELNIPSSVTSIGDSPVNIKAYDDSANGNNTGGGSSGSGGVLLLLQAPIVLEIGFRMNMAGGISTVIIPGRRMVGHNWNTTIKTAGTILMKRVIW